MKRKYPFFTSIGIPSIILIFSVLCMTIFALLTLSNSRNALNTSKLSLEQTKSYYNACSNAAEKINDIQKSISDFYKKYPNESDFYVKINNVFETDNEISYNTDTHVFEFYEIITDTKSLYVKTKIIFPTDSDSSSIKILLWKSVSTAQWEPDTSQSVYKGARS